LNHFYSHTAARQSTGDAELDELLALRSELQHFKGLILRSLDGLPSFLSIILIYFLDEFIMVLVKLGESLSETDAAQIHAAIAGRCAINL
jgi:hypothetical protein